MSPAPAELRAPREEDWLTIADLADVAVGHVPGAPPQHEWVENRRTFEGERLEIVAERDGSVVGYGSVERRLDEPEGTYRVFVVTSWATSLDVAEQIYERLESELAARQARAAWMRELAEDTPLIDFACAHGFEVRERYEYGGENLITLARTF